MSNDGKNKMSNPSPLELAEDILQQTKHIVKYLEEHHLGQPTFSADSPLVPDTSEYQALHNSIKTSLEDLQRLVDGPNKFLRTFCCTGYDLGALQIALDFGFFTHVPATGAIRYEDLARLAGLDVDRVSRVARQLLTYRIFAEDTSGHLSHNSTSIALRNDEEMRSVVHYSLDEMFKAASECSVSLKNAPFEANSTRCPFHTRHGVPIFEYYAQHPEKARRFAKAMAGLTRMDHHIDELRDHFDWGPIKGSVVDVGGGSGHISMSLARIFPHLKFVVQDHASMLAEGESLLTEDVRDRIEFMQHSFFEAQPPVSDAAVFLLRQCTHNWADADVVTMFKGLVPGLEGCPPGTPLLINDIVMPMPGLWPRHRERIARQVDMVMLVSYGAKQRTAAEFEALLREADPRYKIQKIYDGLPLGLIEVHLQKS
ncbi:S-adenosyl-L-methionine-dependent methyltransferase [Xylaria palmicola]|nr:S-adenosyl-L-methionine-dependent methyltransferase [Xylaria palmicola]